MTILALSTMYAQHARFEDGAAFAQYAADAGYNALEVSHSTPLEKLRTILDSGILPVVAVHQPAPWEAVRAGIANCDLNLASLDDSERHEAVAFASRSIDIAAQCGAGSVVLHLGHVGDPQLPVADAALRALYTNEPDFAEAARLRDIRLAAAGPHLARARMSLLELAEHAANNQVVLGIESRIGLHEIPLPHELPVLLEGLDPLAVGYWHDTGHAEVLHRAGYVDRGEWFKQPGVRIVGAHVHDVEGLTDHRAPGRGDLDWDAHFDHLGHLDVLTFEINQFEPDNAVATAPGFIHDLISRRS